MSENHDETKIHLSDLEIKFLNLVMTEPDKVFMCFSERELKRPFMRKDLIENGGKLGVRGVARKYNLTPRKARTTISHIRKNVDKWSE